jgi:hypothetical protein
MIFAVDHIVFAVGDGEHGPLVAALETGGLAAESFRLEFPDSGVASDSWSFGSGGFVELVGALPGASGPDVWFDATPRVIGLGFASDAFGDDTRWSDAEAWTMDEEHGLADGRRLRIHAAGPHRHASPFYVFVMDRPDGRLEFPPRPAGPRLAEVRLHGAEAPAWHRQLADWLGLPVQDGGIDVGGTALTFTPGPDPGVHASLRFTQARAAQTLALHPGHLELAVAPD